MLGLVVRMGTDGAPAFGFQSPSERGFHFGLFGPALLVGGEAEIAIGQDIDFARFQSSRRFHIYFDPRVPFGGFGSKINIPGGRRNESRRKKPRNTQATREDWTETKIKMQLRLFPTFRVFGVFRG